MCVRLTFRMIFPYFECGISIDISIVHGNRLVFYTHKITSTFQAQFSTSIHRIFSGFVNIFILTACEKCVCVHPMNFQIAIQIQVSLRVCNIQNRHEKKAETI